MGVQWFIICKTIEARPAECIMGSSFNREECEQLAREWSAESTEYTYWVACEDDPVVQECLAG